MTLRKVALLLGGVGLIFAIAATESEASRRPFFRCFQPSTWQAAPQQYYQYDAQSGAYRRYSFEPGAEGEMVPAPAGTPSTSPAPAPSRSPSAGDTVRRRLRPGSGN